ncbi:MAG: type II toxin-antitoxin system RelB/DinJ family antitoxin [Methylobacterium sp.]|nr:type II toxin-antitoxin system RelB/DinJ family antitoxin [Methylobacterium sp.]
MPVNAFVRARIDETLKNDAASVLAEMGLTVSDVVRMTLTRIANEKALPFELKAPDAATRAARQEARDVARTRRARLDTAEALLEALDPESR